MNTGSEILHLQCKQRKSSEKKVDNGQRTQPDHNSPPSALCA